MKTIQAIETRYKGYRFRSRLEARWAVFFDALEIAWDYEPQGFKLGGRTYLPDFFFPGWHAWGEVKPAVELLDRRVVEHLATATEYPVIALVGAPFVTWYRLYTPAHTVDDWTREPRQSIRMPASWNWIDLGLSVDGRALYEWPFGSFDAAPPAEELSGAFNKRWSSAVAAARSARFEFGQRGAG